MSWIWKFREDQYVRKHWGKGGQTAKTIAKTLGTRTPSAVASRAKALHLHSERLKPWTATERAVVLANYGPLTAREIARMLPGRSRDAVIGEAYRLRMRGRRRGRATPSLPRLSFMESTHA